jgi:hypothetical protein
VVVWGFPELPLAFYLDRTVTRVHTEPQLYAALERAPSVVVVTTESNWGAARGRPPSREPPRRSTPRRSCWYAGPPDTETGLTSEGVAASCTIESAMDLTVPPAA